MGTRRLARLQSMVLSFALVATLVVVLPPEPALAATFLVDQNDPSCSSAGPVYCTINEGIAASTDPLDIVEVAPGTYAESISIFSDDITIRSNGGSSATTITPPLTGDLMLGVQTATVELDGFTLTGGARDGSSPGGAIWVNNVGGTLTVRNSVITGNNSENEGGAIANWGTLNVIDSEISNNTTGGPGGGISNSGILTVSGSTISGNVATSFGGGIFQDDSTLAIAKSLDVQTSTISNNSATFEGGGIYNGAGTTALVNQSLISGNSSSNGGGIWVDGSDVLVDDVELRNTTISGNTGGGVQTTDNGGATTLYFATVAANDVGVFSQNPGSLTLARTLVADNTTDCLGSVGLAAFNLVSAQPAGCTLTTVGTGDIIGSDVDPVPAELAPLADNGGATFTHALLATSPAIDAAATPALACLPEDQRGIARPQGAAGLCDIGAFEVEATGAGPLQTLIDDAPFDGVVEVVPGTYVENITIDRGVTLRGTGTDAAAVVINGSGTGSAVTVAGDGASFENLTITNGATSGNGAGINVTGVEATVNINDVRITANTGIEGGGVWAAAGNVINIDGSTIDNNTATSGTGTTGGGIGGSATFIITNSTLSGNHSLGNGGGIGLKGGSATLNNVTLAENSAEGRGGAFNGDPLASITISNTLSSGNSNVLGGPNCASLVSLGHNLLAGNPSECTLVSSDLIGVADLGALTDNGGRTPTHALLEGSIGIDGGGVDLSYPAFTGAVFDDWQLNGFTDGSGGELLLAAPQPVFTVGSAYLNTAVPVDQDFSAQFDFRIVPQPGGEGADGITFTIGDSPTALGDGGGYLGIGRFDTIELTPVGVVNGVSVEFDTWVNGAAEGANDFGGNAIGIDIDGNLSSIAQTADIADLSDGSVWTAWIDYEADTTTLEVRASNTGARPTVATLAANVDVPFYAGAQAYVGFTGATGSEGISGEQRVQNLTFTAGAACEAADQRGISRPQRSACDIGAFELEPTAIPTALTVDLADAGAVATDPPIIPIEDLDIATFFGVEDGPASTQLGAIQLGAIQLGAIDGSGLSAPSGYLTIEAIIDAAAELSASSTILDGITLVDVPIVGGWESLLVAPSSLAGRPSYTVTLQQVIDDPIIGPILRNVRLADSGIAASQLGAIQLGAIQLGAIQLGAIQLGAIGDQLTDICAAGEIDCVALGIDPNNASTYEAYSLVALSLLGVSLDFAQLGAIQLGAIDPTGTQLGAIQLGAIQLGAIDATAGTIGNTQLGAIQLGAIQLGAIQLGAISSVPNLVDYWCNDPLGGLDCSALGVTTFSGDELNDYSIVALGAMGADLDVLQLGAIQLGAIGDLVSTQLGAIQLGAIQLGAIDPAASQLGAIQLGAIQLGAIQLGAIDWNNPVFAQLGAIQLGAIGLSASQLGAIQLGAIGNPSSVVNCGAIAGGCAANGALTLADLEGLGLILPTATMADLAGAIDDIPLQVLADAGFDIATLVGAATLLDLLPETTIDELPPDLTLGQLAELWVGMPLFELLLALMDPAELSWEDVDPAVIAAQHPVLSAGWSVIFELSGEVGAVPGSEFPFTADVSVTLPEGVTYVPGTSALAVNPAALPPPTSPLADPVIDGAVLRWIVDGVELNDSIFVEFGLETSFTADTNTPVSATVNTLGFTGGDASPTLVTDLEPNDTFAQAIPVSGDVLVLGRVDTPDDIDLFKLTIPAGGSIEAYLNPGGIDLDLVLFEPGQTIDGELRGPAQQVVDGSLDPVIGIDPTEQDQESLDDIANTDIAPVFKSSLHRGDANESIVTPPLRNGGDFFLQITSYNEEASDDVYVGRIRVIDPPPGSACSARPATGFVGEGIAGTLPSATDLSGAETIYLMNTELFGDTHGATATTEVLNAIAAVGAVAGAPAGVVVPVEGDPAVASAYSTWLGAGGNCSTDAANDVATAIAELVDGYRASHPAITSVVIVGGDDQIPFFRVEDQGIVASERDYLTTFSGNNPLVTSLRDAMVMTDAPYTDANPLYVPQGDREVFVSQLPTGRLVEDPVEIVASLNQFVASGGLLDLAVAPSDPAPAAEVLGYDFLSDSSTNIANELTSQGFSVASTINETWTKADLEAAFDSASALVNSNAHYDHTAALPAEGNLSSVFTDLYTVDDLDPVGSSLYAGTLIYTMGCHAGLNAPASYLESSDPDYDWAQALLGRQAVYLANTGFGYGDSDFQAYSEELMALFTEQFATSNTVGEAFRNAQQAFAGQTPKWSPYHDKSLMEATLYGLPFYRLHESDVTPAPLDTVTPATGGTGLAEASVAASAPLTAGGGPVDDRYLIADDVLAVPFRPVQPLEFIEATSSDPNLRASGAIIEGGSTTDLADFDVLYARPIVYNEAAEPEYETLGAFPNALQAISNYDSPAGPADRLLLSRGRYFPDSRTQQRWESVDLTVYYVPDGGIADVTPPRITSVSGVETSPGNVDFEVAAFDPSGVLRVLVLYKAEGVNGAWTPLELSGSGGSWSAQVTGVGAGQDLDYWAQVLGGDGQVATSTDKADLHDVLPPEPPDVVLTGTVGSNGIFTTSVAVSLTPPSNAPGSSLEISTDGGATFAPYVGAIDLGDGSYEIVGRPVGVSASATSQPVTVDTTDPTITLVGPSGSPVIVAQGAAVPLEYFCADSGSGLAKCAGTVINGASLDTGQVGVHEAQITATDRAGNTSKVVVEYEVSEEDALVLTADQTVVPVNTTVAFTAAFTGDDSHTLTWDFGDGSATLTESGVAGPTATVSHTYTTTGVYPVTVTVTHEGGLAQSATLRYIVVYDPTEGFVTGGGWFDSPSGAFTPQDSEDADLVGRADFGFVSKYKKGQSVPTGNTSFEFAAGDLDFRSTSYDWLVVQGDSKAAFKGVGVIEGWEGEYQFRLTVRDADANESDSFEEDAFRIAIWTVLADGSDWVVYDSGLGTDPDSEQGGTTELGGGSIVIHNGGPGGSNKKK